MSQSGGKQRPIVIRRSKHKKHHGNHGAWKIAYADFMTAMMAFFLVMWLLGQLSDEELKDVGEYFQTPLKVALAGGDKSSASNSAIPGGGDDPTHSAGAVSRTTPRAVNYHAESGRLARLRATLEAEIAQDPALKSLAEQVSIRVVPDGLQIQIFDSKRRPMFRIGSAHLETPIADLLHKIAPLLSTAKNKITLTGHTDDLPYAQGETSYGNWELSTDRANAARRALVVGGMPPSQLLRVVGAADTEHVDGDQPGSPLNRRITILLLNDAAQHRIEASESRAVENLQSLDPTPEARPAVDVAPDRAGGGAGDQPTPIQALITPQVSPRVSDISG